jgi:anti-sigma-K factor RskA
MSDDRDLELRDLIALAAVGALDHGERAALDAEIAGRPELLAELAEMEAVAATFADATSEAPPARVRASVLDAIAHVPQLPALGEDAPAAPVSAAPLTPPMAEVIPMAERRRPRFAPLAAAAAVVVLIAGGLVALNGNDDGDVVDVAAVVDDESSVVMPLDGTLSSIRLVHSSAHRAAALVGEDVPALNDDQVYELWLILDGTPQRLDIFQPHDDGTVEVLMPDMDMPDDAAFAITVEPAGGTDAPTGDVVAATA